MNCMSIVAAGPIGRNAEASGTASIKSVSAVYSYSKTRGLFAGVSLEGSVILERFDANKKLYGHKVQTRDLLNGTIPPPPAADVLYRALELKSGQSSGGRFGYMDSYYDNDSSYRYNSTSDRSDYDRYDNDRLSSNDRYDTYSDNVNRRDDFGDLNGGGTPRSFSRAAVHTMAKTGGYSGGYNSNGNRQRGSSFNSSTWRDDSPRQIAPSPQTTSYSNSGSRDLVLSSQSSNYERRARALFNFAGEQDGDLPFHKGDIITIIKKTDTQNDWWTGKLNNKEGIVSYSFFIEGVQIC